MIIIPIKWLFHWEYTLFSDKPISRVDPACMIISSNCGWRHAQHAPRLAIVLVVSASKSRVLILSKFPDASRCLFQGSIVCRIKSGVCVAYTDDRFWINLLQLRVELMMKSLWISPLCLGYQLSSERRWLNWVRNPSRQWQAAFYRWS